MKKSILFFAILLTTLTSCKKDDKNNSESCYSNTYAQTLVYDGINRQYVLDVPNSYDGDYSCSINAEFSWFWWKCRVNT